MRHGMTPALRCVRAAAAAVACSAALLAGQTDGSWSFDRDTPGGLPSGFTSEAGEWQVAVDETAPSPRHVLAQVARSSGPTFNLALVRESSYQDLEVAVQMKAGAGQVDQGGGLVWRARDRDNYYIARFNPLEDNFRVYKVVDGKRVQLASADVKLPPGWHEVRIAMRGERLECSLDGRKLLESRDASFSGPGKIGLWTKADAVTRFDDLRVKPAAPPGAGLDTARVEELTGLKGALNEEEQVFKVTSPRTDVQVSVDEWTMPPFLGLTSWAAFRAGEKAEAMVMGDLVLLEDEVNPVMSAAFEAGLDVTALHNHFLFDRPKVYFLHIAGEGQTAALAKGVRAALDEVKAVRAAAPTPRGGFGGLAIPATSSITASAVEAILGVKGQAKDGMLKVVIGRKVKLPCGCEVGKEMGVNTWAAFAGSDEQAVVDGDFAVLEGELQAVLRTLRKAGINIVAIHHHMTHEEPRMLFLHYWGKGPAASLARALRSALDAQAAASPPGK